MSEITVKEYNEEKRKRDKTLWSNMSEEKWQAERKHIQKIVKKHFEDRKNGI